MDDVLYLLPQSGHSCPSLVAPAAVFDAFDADLQQGEEALGVQHESSSDSSLADWAELFFGDKPMTSECSDGVGDGEGVKMRTSPDGSRLRSSGLSSAADVSFTDMSSALAAGVLSERSLSSTVVPEAARLTSASWSKLYISSGIAERALVMLTGEILADCGLPGDWSSASDPRPGEDGE